MRVKEVEYDHNYRRLTHEFEHNGVTWFKDFPYDDQFATTEEFCEGLKNFLNSVIEDTIARTR